MIIDIIEWTCLIIIGVCAVGIVAILLYSLFMTLTDRW